VSFIYENIFVISEILADKVIEFTNRNEPGTGYSKIKEYAGPGTWSIFV
jgi:hypothetical protein